ncbi:MAG: choice-of-anchor L domain-containing protein [Planctomycetota bacterium]
MRKITPPLVVAMGLLMAVVASAQTVDRVPLPVGHSSGTKAAPLGAGVYSTQDLSVLTPTQLAQALVGPGIMVSNVSIVSDGTNNADPNAMGAFDDGFTLGIGIDQGIVLSSGDIATAVGPNTADDFTTNLSTGSDPDLQAIATAGLNDSTVLQFEFTDPSIAPGTTGTVQFQFVFGSDEYNEFVDSNFNDTFAFFLNGANIAVLPDLVTPVAINNINCGNPFDAMQASDFCTDFNNNDLQDGGPFFNTEMDGFTNVFTAFGSVTGPGPHTIKLAIADAGDSSYDSWVFLQAGSLQVLTDPSCIPPTPDENTPILACVDLQTINHQIVAVSNSITPGAPSSVSITGVNVTYTAPGGLPQSIGIPAGVMYSGGFPVSGQPATLGFSWSPDSATNPIGLYEFCYQLVDQAGQTGECCITIDVYECMMCIGVQPISLQVSGDPADVLRVDPLWFRPMTLTELPPLYVPNVQALVGFKFYAQGFVYNESVYPTNPLSLSWSIEYTIGVGATYNQVGPPSNIHIYPAGTGVVNPGDTFTIPFTLAGFGGF